MLVPAIKHQTFEDYLEIETETGLKHEFYLGEVFAMSGAAISHNRLVRNSLSIIDDHLKDDPCEVFPSDLRIHIEENSLFTYPGLSIVCEEVKFHKSRRDTILNPTVIIEVLSKSTQNYDRGDKFRLYRDIPTFREYLLISSLEMRVERYLKAAPNQWVFTEYAHADSDFTIDTIGLTLNVGALYRRVDFSDAETPVVSIR